MKPPNLYGILEGAAILLEKANRIHDTIEKANTAASVPVKTIAIPVKELEALARLSELSAMMIDQLIYTIEINQATIFHLKQKEKKTEKKA